MRNYSRSAMVVSVLGSIFLAGDAILFFNDMSFLLGDIFLLVVVILSILYLLKQAEDTHTSANSSLHESSAFHSQLGTEIAVQLSSAHTELGNTQAILSDAIGKLVSNFILISDGVRDLSGKTNEFSRQVHEVVGSVGQSLKKAEQTLDDLDAEGKAAVLESNTQVRAVVDELTAFNNAVTQNAVDLNLMSSNVEQNVLVVISTLQFQDMSSQLIEHARLRMTALQEVANEMGKSTPSKDQKEYLEKIAAYNRLLDKHVVSLDKQKANPVKQKDFGSGDVELF